MYAARVLNNESMVALLLEKGADVNAEDNVIIVILEVDVYYTCFY